MVLLHAAGDLEALGIPLPLLMLLVAGTVPAVAGALSARGQGHTERQSTRHWPLPQAARRLVSSRALRAVARAVLLLAFLGVVAIAAAGPDSVSHNAAPRLALVVVWGGVAAASVLLGPIWRVISPFRTLARWVGRLVDPQETAVRPLPPHWGVWPAAAGLAAWAWVAEAVPSPRVVAVVLLAYAMTQVAGGLWYGQRWFAQAEALEVMSTLLGRLAPLGRDAAGRLGLRDPLASLARLEPAPGLRELIALLLAWELAHAVRGTEWWPLLLADLGLRRGVLAATAALLVAVAVAVAAVRMATPRPFLIAATVPLLAGWTLAHHVGPAMTDWRAALADLADPLGRGWSLHDLTGPPIEPAAPAAVALAQLVLLVVGAAVAVAVGHRMATARYDLRAARAVQFPLRGILIFAILAGVALEATAAA